MFKFFESIANIFTTAVDYIIGLFGMLINLVKFVFKAQTFLVKVIASFPPFLVVFAMVIISLAILFQLLNKGS